MKLIYQPVARRSQRWPLSNHQDSQWPCLFKKEWQFFQTTEGKTKALLPFLPQKKKSPNQNHTQLMSSEQILRGPNAQFLWLNRAPVKLGTGYSSSSSQCSVPRVRFWILILSSTVNTVAVPPNSLVRRGVWHYLRLILPIIKTDQLLPFCSNSEVCSEVWVVGSSTPSPQPDWPQSKSYHRQSQKLRSDIGSVLPKVFCARKAQKSNTHLLMPLARLFCSV